MSFRSLCRTFLWSALLLGLSATANAATVQLQWDANPEPDITFYTVAYGTRTGVYTTTVNVGKVTAYALNLTTPGTYFIAVSASSPLGTSPYSVEVSTTITTTPASNPVLMIDGPTPNQLTNSDTYLTGWSTDLAATSSSGVDAIHVYAYPNPGSSAAPVFLGAAAYGTARADVAAAYGAQFLNSGYSLPIVGLTPGRWDLVLFAHSTVSNTFAVQRGVPITVGAPATGAKLNLDVPRTGDNIQGALAVAGWAVDQRATSGTGVNGVSVWAYPDPGSGRLPIFLGDAVYGAIRADVGSLLGTRFRPSGFELTIVSLAAGLYDVVAFPRSTVTGAYESPRVARVTIRPSVLVMVDRPAVASVVAGSSFTISGWSLDQRASANNGISTLNVWAYKNPGSGTAPVWVGGMNTVVPRGDVAAIYGAQHAMSGYTLNVTGFAPGVYDLVVFAQSSVTGQFENATVVRVTVQ